MDLCVCVCVCVCLCSLSVKCQPSRHLGSHPEMNLSLTPMLCIVTASQANFNRISWISEGKCKFKQDPICWSYLYIGNWLRRDKQMHQFYSQVPLKDNLVSDFQFLSPTKQEKKTLTVHMGAKDDNITLCHTLILLLSMCMWSLAHQSAGLCGSKKKKSSRAPSRAQHSLPAGDVSYILRECPHVLWSTLCFSTLWHGALFRLVSAAHSGTAAAAWISGSQRGQEVTPKTQTDGSGGRLPTQIIGVMAVVESPSTQEQFWSTCTWVFTCSAPFYSTSFQTQNSSVYLTAVFCHYF